MNVTLGSVIYEVERLPLARAMRWRKQAEAVLTKFPQLVSAYNKDVGIESSLSLYVLANEVLEELVDLVLSSSDSLANKRDEILEQATENEFMEALQALMLLNAPFVGLALPTSTANGEIHQLIP